MKSGASMTADGTIESFVFTYADFPLLQCSNPAVTTISKEDLEHVTRTINLISEDIASSVQRQNEVRLYRDNLTLCTPYGRILQRIYA